MAMDMKMRRVEPVNKTSVQNSKVKSDRQNFLAQLKKEGNGQEHKGCGKSSFQQMLDKAKEDIEEKER